MDQPLYLDHFRLRSAPFGPAPEAALFYAHGARHELLGALAYAVTHGDGIVKITGDAGSGMTMLCYALAARLAGQAVVIPLEPGNIGPLGVIHAMALALGIDPDGKRSDEVLRELQGYLAAMRAGGRQAVLMAEHADALPPGAMEEIRLLTNLDDVAGKLLQIVLLGGHALNTRLRQNALRQVRERITLSFVMPRLEDADVPALLAHRLRAAGYEGLDLFASDAARLLASHARGDLRRLVHGAHEALAAAASEGAVSVTAHHVRAALRGQLPMLKPRLNTRPMLAGAMAAVALIGIGGAVLWQQWPRGATAASLPMYTGVIKSMPVARASADATGAAANAADDAPQTSAMPAPVSATGSATRSATGSDTASAAPPDGNAAVPSAITVTRAVADAAEADPRTGRATDPRASSIPAGSQAGMNGPAVEAVSPASVPPAAPAASLLQQTLASGTVWLRGEADHHYSVKIEDFAAADSARAEAFLAEVRGAVGLDDVHAYATLNKGVRHIGIAFGSFDSEAQARNAMAQFAGRWRYAPKIRKVGDIRAAVARATRAQPRAQQ